MRTQAETTPAPLEASQVLSRARGRLYLKKYFAFAVALLASGALHAAEPERFIAKIKLPSGQTAVVAEGDLEARSIGSFSVRLSRSS